MDATYQRQPDGGIPRYARHLTAALKARGDIDIVEIGGGRREKRHTLRRRLVTIGLDFGWHPLIGSRYDLRSRFPSLSGARVALGAFVRQQGAAPDVGSRGSRHLHLE